MPHAGSEQVGADEVQVAPLGKVLMLGHHQSFLGF